MNRATASGAILVLVAGLCACGGESAKETGSTQPPAAKPAGTKPPKPKVLRFYPAEGVVTQGAEVTVCYGVENAEEVIIEPGGGKMRPSWNRCIALVPQRSGIFKLTARGPGGEDSAEFALKVVPAHEPETVRESMMIPMFVASQDVVAPGAQITLCYSVEGADKLTLEPPVQELEPESRCFTAKIDKTTSFKLTATGGGRTQSRVLRVQVR